MFFRKRTLLAVALLIFLYIIFHFVPSHDPGKRGKTSLFDGFWTRVILPVNSLIELASTSTHRLVSDYFLVVKARRENRRLKEELKTRDLKILSLNEALESERQIKTIFESLNGLKLNGIAARVVAHDPYSFSQTLWVSAGSAQGVKMDDPVMAVDGLVGRVVRVFKKKSQVLLMIDPHFSVDGVVLRSRVRTLVAGSIRGAHVERYPALSRLEFLNTGDDIRVGDRLLTSGLGPIYPAAIPVGQVVADGGRMSVLPAVDFSSVSDVVILKK